MGSKPWLSVGALFLGGLLLCGCQNQQKTASTSPFGPNTNAGVKQPDPKFPGPVGGLASNTPGSPTSVGPTSGTFNAGAVKTNAPNAAWGQPVGTSGAGTQTFGTGFSNPGTANALPLGANNVNPVTPPSNPATIPAGGFGNTSGSSGFATSSSLPPTSASGPSLPPATGFGGSSTPAPLNPGFSPGFPK